VVPTATKVALIERLADAGLRMVEAGSFVSPKWVPQMADAAEVLPASGAARRRYPVLVPNLQGYEAAEAAGVEEIAVFGAASESFNAEEHQLLDRRIAGTLPPGLRAGQAEGCGARLCLLRARLPLRGRRCRWPAWCAWRGAGMRWAATKSRWATPSASARRRRPGDARRRWPARGAAAAPGGPLPRHLRAGAGQHPGLPGIGRAVVDSSVAGLGGCPYAKGATGNVASEDVVYLLRGLGIDLDRRRSHRRWAGRRRPRWRWLPGARPEPS
jgi:hydroxymethylglutaryl-CoA lyase